MALKSLDSMESEVSRFLGASDVRPRHRAEHDRNDLRYPSDLTDAEWQVLAPLFPPPAKTGRPAPA